jgi:hypothetical protein
MPAASAPSVRMAKPAVESLHALPADQAASVARAIRRVGAEPGVPLEGSGGEGSQQSMAMISDDDNAPVVIYQRLPLLEGGGYFVTGLLDRSTYNTYTRVEQPGFFDTPAGKAILLAGAALAIGILVSRSNTGGVMS